MSEETRGSRTAAGMACLLALAAAGCAGTRTETAARAAGPGPGRARQMLGGVWELHAVPDDPKQAELAALKTARWHKLRAPFNLSKIPGLDRKGAEKVHYAWARRSFTAPAETKHRSAVLHVDGLCWGSKIWVNGQEIGGHLGGYGAYEFDLSAALKWGAKNELLVRITGWPVIPRSRKKAANHYLEVPLIPHGAALFRWGSKQARFHGRIWVDYFDRARLERVQILADTDGTLRVRGLSRNYTRHYGERQVRARILRGGREVARGRAVVPGRYTAFSPRTPYAFEMSMKVPRPALWSPEAPNLYRAELELVQDGRALDRWAGNFGFRRFEARPDGFYLNGRRTFLRGVCFWGEGASWPHGMRDDPRAVKSYFIDLPRAAGVRAIRHHTIPVDGLWLEMADRHGMMLLQEFPMTINYIRPDFSKEELNTYRRNVIEEFRTMLPLYWNHPSVILWVPTNESPRQNAAWENGPLQALFKGADPSRPAMRSGVESDDIFDTHCYSGFWDGSEGQFALYAAEMARQGRAAGKPVGNTEYVENFGGGRVTKWMGPKPKSVSDAEWQARRRDVHAGFILEQSEVLRRLGYDVTLPYAWGGGYLRRPGGREKKWAPLPNFYALRSAMSPVLASIDLADRHFVAGSELACDLAVCDDTGANRKLEVRLVLVSGNPGFQWPSRRKGVKVVAERVVTVPAGRRGSFAPRRRAVNMKLPGKPGRYYLLAITPQEQRPAAVSRRVLHLVPPPPVARLAGRKVAVVDADGTLAAKLKKLAPGLELAGDPARAQVAVVGPFVHRELKKLAGAAGALKALAASGGRVVVLEQDRPLPPLGLEVPRVHAQGGASTAFRTAGRNFRAWRGLGDDDRVFRRMNGPTGALVRRPLAPAKGDEVLLSAAQRGSGLKWAVVARRKVGEGEVVFCQMPLHRHLVGKDADPVAQTITVNLLAE